VIFCIPGFNDLLIIFPRKLKIKFKKGFIQGIIEQIGNFFLSLVKVNSSGKNNMTDKDHEPGDRDFEKFLRENSGPVLPFPLIVLREKVKAILTMYSDTLEGYIKLTSMEIIDTDKKSDLLKDRLTEYLDTCAKVANETFEQFNFLLIEDDENDDPN
jgi:hypothetical protein